MGIEEIYEVLKTAKRPIDVFGDYSEEEIKKKYIAAIKICHPDRLRRDKETMGHEASSLLNVFYQKALDEIKNHTYNSLNRDSYIRKKPIFELNVSGKDYKFYEQIAILDTSSLYYGLCNNKEVYLKIANENDNKLIQNEYELISRLDHHSIPTPLEIIKINGLVSIIFDDFGGMSLEDFKEEYGNLNQEHIGWVLERLLSSVGYLHSNNIVNGNIKPSNLWINPENHNITIIDNSLAVENASEVDSKYTIKNDIYTPDNINSKSRVLPYVDIYAVGKIAINLLGGDINSNELPKNLNPNLKDFILKLVSKNENDAYKLWNEIIEIRNNMYGNKRFTKLEKKFKKGGI